MDVKNYIFVYDDFMNLNHLSSLIKWLNKISFKEAETGSGLQKNIRSAGEYHLSNQSKSLTDCHWYNFLFSKFFELVKNYNGKLADQDKSCTTRVNEIIALKYEQGDYYKVHTDNFTKFPRTLSIILFLNDDYEGGAVSFKCARTLTEILKVKPKAGRVVIFPSNFMFPHAVENVNNGTRYSIVSWIS